MANKRKVASVTTAVLILTALGVYLALTISRSVRNLNLHGHNDLPPTFTVRKEDSDLISKKYLPKLQTCTNFNMVNRNPFTGIDFDNDYVLLIHKISLSEEIPLRNIVSMTEEYGSETSGEIYNVQKIGHFTFYIRYIAEKPISEIHLSLIGDSLQTVVNNDSLLGYRIMLKNLSVKYQKTEPTDIVITRNEKRFGLSKSMPMDILFKRKKERSSYYFLTPKNKTISLTPDMLYNIVNAPIDL